MKYGILASKELAEYLRDRLNLEEYNHKILSKISHKAGSNCLNSSFSPLWILLKSSTEELSELHLQLVQKISDLVKHITKYADELHKKYKTVKEEECRSQEAVLAMKESNSALQKSKDLCHIRSLELDKLIKENAPCKDKDKCEAKLKKIQEDFKAAMEKHSLIRSEYEKRMKVTCKRFQEMEENYLSAMKEFLSLFVDIFRTNVEGVNQVRHNKTIQAVIIRAIVLIVFFVKYYYCRSFFTSAASTTRVK